MKLLPLRLLVMCLALGWHPTTLSALEIWFAQPEAGVPLSGRVEVEIGFELDPSDELRFIELRLDDRPLERLRSAPFRWFLDLGDSLEVHRLVAEAVSVSDQRARALLVIPSLRVDEQVEVSLQQLFVTVTDDRSRVTWLERGDFVVLEDGRQRPILTFERGDIPLTALLMLDASGSMKGRRIDLALAGARSFVELMEPLDRTALLLFSDRTVRSTDFTGFREVLATGLDQVAAGGATSLVDHLFVGLTKLDDRQGRRVIILLSDGLDSSSVLEMQDLLLVARHSSALVYWLRLPLDGGPQASFSSAWRNAEAYRRELELLQQLVDGSGGRTFALAGIDDVATAYREVLSELRDQYVLGFAPSEDQGDGDWRRVRVKLNRSGLRVRYRDGYSAIE